METLNYLKLTFDLMCVYIHWKSKYLKSFSWNEIDISNLFCIKQIDTFFSKNKKYQFGYKREE